MHKHITRKTMDKSIIEKFPSIRPKTDAAKARLNALKAYIGFRSMKEIWTFGVSTTEVIRMYNRAHELHEDGRYWGYRVCERFVYVVERRRKNVQGGFGRFLEFLNSSNKELAILRRALDQARRKPINVARFHREIFIPFCRSILKINDDQYPLNTADICYSSLRRLIKKPLCDKVKIAETDEDALAIHSDLMRRLIRHAKPLQVCQFDECKIDLAGFVAVRDADGELNYVAFRDATMLLLVDASHPIIWAYIVFFHPVVSKEDMLLFLTETDVAWSPRKIAPGKRNYTVGAGLPSGVFPDFVGGQPTTLMGDRALAHKAFLFAMQERFRRGYQLHLGPPHRWSVRSSVEGVFSVIDRTHIHNEDNTTGTGPGDPRRDGAFERAADMHFTEVDLKDRVSVAITDFMVIRHGGRKTAMEHIRELQTHDKNYMIRKLPPPVEGGIPIGSVAHWMTVKDSSTGKCVEHYAVWHGPGLNDLPLKSKVECIIDVRDVRTITVYFEGAGRGKLVIEARWRTGGLLSYASLVAAARSKRSGKNKHYPERSAEDVETALQQLEQSVARLPKSKRNSPNAGATLVAELRPDLSIGDPIDPSPKGQAGGEYSSPSSPAPASLGISEALVTPCQAGPNLPEDVLQRIKSKKLIYLGGE